MDLGNLWSVKRRVPAIVIASWLGSAGCASDDSASDATIGTTAPGSSTSQSTTTTGPVPTPPSPEHAELIRTFLHFAADPSPPSAAQVPFAAEVSLGLGDTLHDTRARDALADEAVWSIPMSAGFRGYVGPFSALETASEAGDDVVISVGPHRHCASPPVPPPDEVADLRRVSVQPAPSSIDTCLKWWTVDLFLTPEDEVAAVTLDLWEP